MKKSLLILFLSVSCLAASPEGVKTSTGTVKKPLPKKPAQVHVSTRTATSPASKAAKPVPKVSPELLKRRTDVHTAASKMNASQAPALMQGLSDKDALVRELSVRGLGDLHWGPARVQIETLLTSDPDAHVRETSASALKQLGSPHSLPALIKGTQDVQEEVRIVSVDALGMSTSTGAVRAVEAALKDSAVNVRRTAVIALPRMGHSTSVGVLTTAAQDPDVYVRANAIDGLSLLASHQVLPVFTTALKDKEPLVQVNAARALAKAGDPSGLKTIEPLVNSTDRIVRMSAVDAMGWSKDASAQTLLKGLAQDPDIGVQQAVQLSLERLQRGKNEKKK